MLSKWYVYEKSDLVSESGVPAVIWLISEDVLFIIGTRIPFIWSILKPILIYSLSEGTIWSDLIIFDCVGS